MNVALVLAGLLIVVSAADAREGIHPVISKDSAVKIALARIPGGRILEAELEHERGKWIWSMDVRAGGAIHEIWVDPMRGTLLRDRIESAAAEAREAKRDAVEAAALRVVSGRVRSVRAHGARGWEIRIVDSAGVNHAVMLDTALRVRSH